MSDVKSAVGRFPHAPITSTALDAERRDAARRTVLKHVSPEDVDLVLAMLDLDEA